jgi:hypothetical protein
MRNQQGNAKDVCLHERGGEEGEGARTQGDGGSSAQTDNPQTLPSRCVQQVQAVLRTVLSEGGQCDEGGARGHTTWCLHALRQREVAYIGDWAIIRGDAKLGQGNSRGQPPSAFATIQYEQRMERRGCVLARGVGGCMAVVAVAVTFATGRHGSALGRQSTLLTHTSCTR